MLHLGLRFSNDLYELADYTVLVEWKDSYGQRLFTDLDTLQLPQYNIHSEGLRSFYKIPLEYPESKPLLILSFHNKHNQNSYYFDIDVNQQRRMGLSELLLVDDSDRPVLRNYVAIDESFNLTAINRQATSHWFQYNRDFEIAEPPMIVRGSRVQPTLSIDSTFTTPINESFALNEGGLYFVQTDSSNLQGLAFRVVDQHFPKVAKVEDMIATLRYFTTRSEWTKLSLAVNKKKALDNFWLQVTKSEQRARRIIKNYFRHVELANTYFSGYKEGWKTDMGMVYIIYGPPDEVFRNASTELWVYNKNDNFGKMRYSFSKVPNLFSNNHYVLNREKGYQNNWFRAVDLWRKGRYGLSSE